MGHDYFHVLLHACFACGICSGQMHVLCALGLSVGFVYVCLRVVVHVRMHIRDECVVCGAGGAYRVCRHSCM